jgi:hypothetical protein
MNIKPVMIHLQSHGTSKYICGLKKSNSYMTRLPLVIQEMENKHKNIHTPLDVQRSKLDMQVLHELMVGNTSFSLIFFAILGKRSSFNYHFNGKLK